MAGAITSPCINVCVIDQANGLCLGCLRTIAEIAAWARMSEAERQRIVATLPDRGRPTVRERERTS